MGIEFNPEDGNIYIADYTQDFLTILNPKTEKIIDEIEVGDAPVDLAIDTIQDRVYVTNRGSNDLSVVDIASKDLIETIPIGTDVWGIALDSSNNKAYVASWLGEYGLISVVDGITLKVIETIRVPDGPLYQLAFNPSNNKLYAINHGGESVTITDTNTNEIITEASVKGQPFGISIDKNNDMVYVSIRSDNSLSIIDGNEDREIKNVKMYSIGSTYEIDTDPIKNKIFVANYGAEGVSVLDSLSYEILEFIPVDGLPFGLAFDSNNDKLFVGIPDSNILSIIANATSTSKPIADAGADQLVKSNSLVQLNGSNSSDPDGSHLAFSWSQVSGSHVELNDATSATPSFTAPEVNEETEILFNLTVSNEFELYDSDLVTITVSPLPPLANPTADAGPDQSVQGNDIVQLDGRNSSDPNNTPLTYFWNQIAGPQVTLSDSTSSNPTFTAPETEEQINLIFQLTVTNGNGITSEPDEVIININPVTTPPPEEENPGTLSDLIKDIIQNPLDITNSIESANEIKDILTDDDRDNDQLVCNLLDSEDERTTSSIRELLNC